MKCLKNVHALRGDLEDNTCLLDLICLENVHIPHGPIVINIRDDVGVGFHQTIIYSEKKFVPCTELKHLMKQFKFLFSRKV